MRLTTRTMKSDGIAVNQLITQEPGQCELTTYWTSEQFSP